MKQLKAAIERLKKEYEEIGARKSKLITYMKEMDTSKITAEEYIAMNKQINIMNEYQQIIFKRICLMDERLENGRNN